MSSLVELMAELSTTCYSVGSCHWVEVTHINKPNDFYVRPTAYKSHLRMLEAYEGPVEESRLKQDSIVVYKSPKRKGYIRGQIKDLRDEEENKMCDMFALDYGFIETVSADCLKSPKREGMPALSVRCELELCHPRGKDFDRKAIEAMKYYVGSEAAKMIVKGETADKLIVQLINSCPGDISTMLTYSEDATFGYETNSTNRLTSPNQPNLVFTYKKIRVGDSIPVRVQSGDSLQSFYVTDLKDHREFVSEFSDLTMYLRLEMEMRPEDVKAGKPVGVYNGFRYERGIVKEVTVPAEKAIIQLVDCGKIIEANIATSRVKALEREYYFVRPALAIFCSTDDKQAWDNGLPRFLFPGYEFIITVKKVGKDLDTPNIVNLTKIR